MPECLSEPAVAPPVWVVAHAVGEPSEPWLWRQITGLRRVRPQVVCWRHTNDSAYPLHSVARTVLKFDPHPFEGPGRWWYRLRNLREWNFFASVGTERRFLYDLARRTRPRVVLGHFGHFALRVAPVTRRLGIPLVAHFHGMDLSSMLRNKWYRTSLRRALSTFAALVVVGSHQQRWLMAQGVSAERIHLIPCGVPVHEYTPAERNGDAGPRFLCVSRLIDFKGVDISIRAFAAVAPQHRRAELVIIGGGPDQAGLEELARHSGAGARIRFLGDLPSSQARAWFRSSDVFLQHSVNGDNGWVEGFGVSIAEASSSGLPVVVTDCGGIPDQVVDGETGLIVPQRNVKAMAAAMRRLAEDAALRERMGRAGRQRAVDCFDVRRQIARLEDVLLTVIEENANAHC
jgi:colanic acid/amylovoran biosynthesis glycosyltransferase